MVEQGQRQDKGETKSQLRTRIPLSKLTLVPERKERNTEFSERV